MQVRVYQTVDIEADVSVDVDNISLALVEHLQLMRSLGEDGEKPARIERAILRGINDAYAVLKAAASRRELVEPLTRSQRDMIADRLQELVVFYRSDANEPKEV